MVKLTKKKNGSKNKTRKNVYKSESRKHNSNSNFKSKSRKNVSNSNSNSKSKSRKNVSRTRKNMRGGANANLEAKRFISAKGEDNFGFGNNLEGENDFGFVEKRLPAPAAPVSQKKKPVIEENFSGFNENEYDVYTNNEIDTNKILELLMQPKWEESMLSDNLKTFIDDQLYINSENTIKCEKKIRMNNSGIINIFDKTYNNTSPEIIECKQNIFMYVRTRFCSYFDKLIFIYRTKNIENVIKLLSSYYKLYNYKIDFDIIFNIKVNTGEKPPYGKTVKEFDNMFNPQKTQILNYLNVLNKDNKDINIIYLSNVFTLLFKTNIRYINQLMNPIYKLTQNINTFNLSDANLGDDESTINSFLTNVSVKRKTPQPKVWHK